MNNQKTLCSYIAAVSRLSGCLQFMHSAEQEVEEGDSDLEEMDATDFKAAEQEVYNNNLFEKVKMIFNTFFFLYADNGSMSGNPQ